VRRCPVSMISDMVYGITPMPTELAETIRALRLKHRFAYEDVMWALCESDPAPSQCYGFGKALVELACLTLKDFDPNWK
jgi:hypothetical protein